jgi:anti-sigma regulatory factor (Ser/Thr protein kinase)
MASRKTRFELRVPAQPSSVSDLRNRAVTFAAELGFEDTGPIALAVSEAATNAVIHAYRDSEPGDIRMVVCDKPDRLVVVVRDYGGGMMPRADSPGLGLGLPMISTMANDLQIEAAEGAGTLLRMHFTKPARQAAA